mgnify:CR=1 FL=1
MSKYICYIRPDLFIQDRLSCLIDLIEKIEDPNEKAEYWTKLRNTPYDSQEYDVLIEELAKKLGLVVKYVYTR